MTRRKLVFTSGPYRGPSSWAIECNIRRAEQIALEIWRLGHVGICPHSMTRYFQGAAPDEVWLAGDLELLKRCDAVAVCPGWQSSSGTLAELEVARDIGLPIFYENACFGSGASLDYRLVDWLRNGELIECQE